MKRAALYLRSSKDRKDVSPDAQRRALQELARSRGETIAAEFVDKVESGKDENRPGFRDLVKAVRNPKRGWDTLLLYDTARLSRRRVISVIFEEIDCKPNGVQVVYRSLPDLDPMTEVLLKSVVQAMDEYHSLSSREKGLAGMAENVRQGWRAGGRAPHGYRLKRMAIGAVRDGEAVTKTKLEPDPATAPRIGEFLRLRASNIPRAKARELAHVGDIATTTLIGIEWNALTYAGHTVWNVHADAGQAAKTGKRRPRKEWLIQRDTHPALISDPDAEELLRRLEAAATARRTQGKTTRERDSGALLGGRLVAPDGRKWWAETDRYRLPGKPATSIAKPRIDEPVLEQVLADLSSPEFTVALMRGTREALASESNPAEIRRLRGEIVDVAKQVEKMLDMAAQMDEPAAALRRVQDLEATRQRLEQQLQDQESASAAAQALASISTEDVRRELAAIAEMALEGDKGAESAVMALVDRIELDPATLDAWIHYRIASTHVSDSGNPQPGVKVASPRGFEPRSLP